MGCVVTTVQYLIASFKKGKCLVEDDERYWRPISLFTLKYNDAVQDLISNWDETYLKR